MAPTDRRAPSAGIFCEARAGVDRDAHLRDFYGLNEQPFDLSPDPKFLHSVSHDKSPRSSSAPSGRARIVV
jgi:hypothetical protein